MKVIINGVEVELEPSGATVTPKDGLLEVVVDGVTVSAAVAQRDGKRFISFGGRTFVVESVRRNRSGASGSSNGTLTAPLPAVVIEVLAQTGDEVEAGQRIMVLEAMKTQQPVTAPFAGVVSEICVAAGQQLTEGQLLAKVQPNA